MTVYHHLAHALRIMREEPNWREWGPLIDDLTPEQQAEVRPWLRQEAERRRGLRRATNTTAMPTFEPASRQPRKPSPRPKAGS